MSTKDGLAPVPSDIDDALSRRMFIKVGMATGGGAVLGSFLPLTSRHAQAASPADLNGHGDSMSSQITSAPKSNLYLVEDLEDAMRTRELAEGDLGALRAVADWIKTFVAKPHRDLGRPGSVCPFVPRGLERKTLWLAPEHIASRGLPEVVQLIKGYRNLFLRTQPTAGDEVNDKSIVVVFTDLTADRAKEVFDSVLKESAVSSYVDDGLVMGAF